MEFLILAKDGTDAHALDRRLAVREAHLALARRMKAEGKIRFGGAQLDEAGRMVGSALLVEFPDRAAVDAWLREDPYVTGDVWAHVEVIPFRSAPI